MKRSKWQILKAKLKGLEKQCWTMYKCNSDTMVAILPRKGNIHSRIFMKNYCLLPMFSLDHFLNYNVVREKETTWFFLGLHIPAIL